ncbi:hypothetical protein GCM10010502_01450 [Kitasatospora aureofaciens]|uniref:Uncharacterized protein n=1 Tax=Kitasatospora aureofaciens TaxID=1894 RepID=A0A8H9HFN1_KITAU|nr:hypothetical protein GCM10010502_01450 [Kitasatospora aureofaciens]
MTGQPPALASTPVASWFSDMGILPYKADHGVFLLPTAPTAIAQASAGADPTMDGIQVKNDTKPVSGRETDRSGRRLVNSGPPRDLNR